MKRYLLFPAWLYLLASLCGAAPRYDQITWLCTHNSMSSSEAGWKLANQTHTIEKQLSSGVRALMLDIHVQDRKLVLRHGPPAARVFGFQPLPDALQTIRTFLVRNPDAIVTLILESYAPSKDVAAAISNANLATYCHTQNTEKPWPTLDTLRKSGKRLVVFSDRVEKGTTAPDWYMYVWQHCWETDWQAVSTDDLLNAKQRRGKQSNKLFILNHFITNTFPSRKASKDANSLPFLSRRIAKARKDFGKKPNFLVLDFYEQGDASSIVKRLNQQGN